MYSLKKYSVWIKYWKHEIIVTSAIIPFKGAFIAYKGVKRPLPGFQLITLYDNYMLKWSDQKNMFEDVCVGLKNSRISQRFLVK